MDVSLKQRNEGQAEHGARVAPLAKLPVFWALEGRRVIVAGGSDAAAWKAELLAACGAQVHVHAETLSDTFENLMARRTDHPGGGFVHHSQTWHADGLAGAALAIADCEDEDEARAFFDTARSVGVPVNVIDRPAFCQFQFGSIVNRSPVVVAISTDGAAPILAQAIRRRIETLLPQSLKGWASLAQSLRDRINERLRPGAPRRAFWERFVDRAFGAAPDEKSEAAILDDAARLVGPAIGQGRVTLVGAGPGEAELLTLKAVRALQAADVILFDNLVSNEVLELARRESRRMLVGKRGGRESCRQEDINAMMLAYAKAGKQVVRLKSGDPMVFGRAGEEIACLEAEGIPVEVVPGITAASAMASRLGVSLTHRDHAQAVRFVTGHSQKGALPELDWSCLADAATTTIFYMAGRTAGDLAERLIASGASSDMPAVVASALTRPCEKIWTGSLLSLPDAVADIGLDQPVLIGIGSVFGARVEQLSTRHDPIMEPGARIRLS
ncbi:siroheme synthase CysG [Aureimonas altamirensis]|uniref:siroheme synthase CysG n=1 Tax=Aureimonas altamirensis TaxID=370622 RepID=UPI00068BDA53|nr:siroheme synthase CysG [Aureimonas altamirensis]